MVTFVYVLMLFVIADFPGSFGYDAQSRGLSSVPTDIPSNSATVSLNNNRITNVTSGVFSHLLRCTKLNLKSNQIDLIESGAFTGLHILKHLGLSFNNIQSVESTMWTGLEYLEILGLNNNYITTISPESFSGLIWLKTLWLGSNYLGEINKNMWVGLQSLENLSLRANRLKDFPRHGISHIPSLESLSFAENQLKTLRVDIFNPDDYTEYSGRPRHLNLYFHDNPLQCDVKLCWLKVALHFGSITFVGSDPKCANLDAATLQDVELNCTSGAIATPETQPHLPTTSGSITGSGNDKVTQEEGGVNGLYLGLGIAAGALVLVIMVVTSIIIACKVKKAEKQTTRPGDAPGGKGQTGKEPRKEAQFEPDSEGQGIDLQPELLESSYSPLGRDSGYEKPIDREPSYAEIDN